MKYIFSILILTMSLLAYSKGGGHAGGHSGHAGESEAQSHAQSEHYAEQTVHESDYHTRTSNNTTIYYYLLLNQRTHKMDTIQATSKDSLTYKIQAVTGKDQEPWTAIIIVVLFIGLIFVFLLT